MVSIQLLAESYLHRLDPVAIPLSGALSIRWYGLAYLAGFIIAWVMIKWLVRTGRSLIPEEAISDLMVFIIAGVLIGGRLGYAIFYDPALLIEFSSQPPWWEFLNLPRGGMASHGGIIGVIAALLIFAHRHRLPSLHLVDVAAFVVPPGLFLGRLANFINGELWGKALSAQMQKNPPWWSIKYPEEVHDDTIDVSMLSTHIGGNETLRETTVASLQDGDPIVIEAIVPQLTAWWPSQLIQAICEGPLLLLVLIAIWWKPRKPGVLAGWFLITYGVLRIATEIVRQPDDGVVLILGLQRGQILSVVMVLIGIIIVLWCSRRVVAKIGGINELPDTTIPPPTPPTHASN